MLITKFSKDCYNENDYCMNKNKIITIVVIVVIVVISSLVIFKLKFSITPAPKPLTEEESKSLGEEISDQVNNPAEALPNNNVFENAKVNPYKDVYKNPFE